MPDQETIRRAISTTWTALVFALIIYLFFIGACNPTWPDPLPYETSTNVHQQCFLCSVTPRPELPITKHFTAAGDPFGGYRRRFFAPSPLPRNPHNAQLLRPSPKRRPRTGLPDPPNTNVTTAGSDRHVRKPLGMSHTLVERPNDPLRCPRLRGLPRANAMALARLLQRLQPRHT